MVTYSVNMGQVEQVAEEMQSITTNLQRTLDDLESSSKQNLAEWTLSAKGEYEAAKAQWDAAAGRMTEQLGRAQQALGAINELYSHAERQGQAMWGSR
jgi:WXG100 family type VII secretion target